MASQNGDHTRQHRKPISKTNLTLQDERSAYSLPSSSAEHAGRNLASRPDHPRAASPSAPTIPVRTPTPSHTQGAGFATGEDYISFEFSDDEESEGDGLVNVSQGRGKDQAHVDENRSKGLKRTASQVELGDHGYANKKQRMGDAARLTPWTKDVDWDNCRNLAEMLHREVKSFVNYISPTPEEHEVRSMVIAMISRAVRSSWPDAQVLPFGSFETKLYLPLGDIDLVIQSPIMEHYEKRRILYNLAQVLRRANITDNVTVIGKARVPIVKFVTSYGRLSVDISLNQGNGVMVGGIVNRFLHELPALRSLVLVIKLFLSQRSMNEVYTGGLGSYAIVCMAVSFLQMHPKIRSGEIDPSENLGVLMMEFFELYGHYYNYDNTGISIRDGGTYFNKKDRGWMDSRQTFLLSIEDPSDISNDISKSSYNITRVRKNLAGAHEVLASAALMRARVLASKAQRRYTSLHPPVSRNEYDNCSILGSVLSITQETLNHRRMIRQLYEKNTLQTLLGHPLYRPEPVVIDGEAAASRSSAAYGNTSRSQSTRAVEAAWGEADMDLSDSDGEQITQRQTSPEIEESRYSNRRSRKRRRLEANGKQPSTADPRHTIFVSDSEEERRLVSRIGPRAPSKDAKELTASDTQDARNHRRQAYWASKGLSGGSLEDRD